MACTAVSNAYVSMPDPGLTIFHTYPIEWRGRSHRPDYSLPDLCLVVRSGCKRLIYWQSIHTTYIDVSLMRRLSFLPSNHDSLAAISLMTIQSHNRGWIAIVTRGKVGGRCHRVDLHNRLSLRSPS
jgi:hypothetical protein